MLILFVVFAGSSCRKSSQQWLKDASLRITANTNYLRTGGQAALITVVGFRQNGESIPDGSIVIFDTTLGKLEESTVSIQEGQATAIFYSDDRIGVAEIRATCMNITAQPYPLEIFIESPDQEMPEARFTYSPIPPYTNQVITFDAADSKGGFGTIVSYEWDFGDGNTGIGRVVHHSFETPGTLYVILTVTNDQGVQDTKLEAITILSRSDEPPAANFTISNYNPKVNEDVQFDGDMSTGGSGRIVSWHWDFGDKSTGSGEKAVHRYTESRTYLVTLTVTNEWGVTDTKSDHIKVTN